MMMASILTCSSGCTLFVKTIPVYPRMPTVEIPQRPQLENVAGSELVKMNEVERNKVINNTVKLVTYSKKLEISLIELNNYAVENNKKYEGYLISTSTNTNSKEIKPDAKQ